VTRVAPTPRAEVSHHQSVRVEGALREAVDDEGVISFAGGVPADELFPTKQVAAALAEAVRADGPSVLQYGWSGGLDRLREQIAARMALRGVQASSANVLVTSGAQQALSLLSQLLVPVGAPVAVEVPTYTSALQAFDLRRPAYRKVERSAGAIDLDGLSRAVGEGAARVVYVIANGHNPTGGVLGATDRQGVVDRCRAHGAWLIDDDAYGELQFGDPAPSLLALAGLGERVVHVGSFSKVLAPGLRVGWVVGSEALVRELGRLKQAQDLETAPLNQRILSAWLDTFGLSAHLAVALGVYRERRDALVDALRVLPASVKWTAPSAGFSLLVELPAGMDASALLRTAVSRGVGFEPAAAYYVDEANVGALRLSYSNVSIPDIREGVRRLAPLLSGPV